MRNNVLWTRCRKSGNKKKAKMQKVFLEGIIRCVCVCVCVCVWMDLATWCKELTHLKRPWCWERLKAGGEGDDRGWDDWMASPTQWTWVWVNSGSRWWTGRPGMLQSMGSQRVEHDWATELNWFDYFPGSWFVELTRWWCPSTS